MSFLGGDAPLEALVPGQQPALHGPRLDPLLEVGVLLIV